MGSVLEKWAPQDETWAKRWILKPRFSSTDFSRFDWKVLYAPRLLPNPDANPFEPGVTNNEQRRRREAPFEKAFGIIENRTDRAPKRRHNGLNKAARQPQVTDLLVMRRSADWRFARVTRS